MVPPGAVNTLDEFVTENLFVMKLLTDVGFENLRPPLYDGPMKIRQLAFVVLFPI